MVRVNWTTDAISDVDGIAEYIARDSHRNAAAMVVRFLAVDALLSEHPRMGKRVPELGLEAIRELIVGSYRVIYVLVSETRIDILTVHHQKRLLPPATIARRLRRRT